MRRAILLCTLIALMGAFLRTHRLDSNPPGFFRDEADKGYTTFSLLETGRDQSGRSLPLFVRSLNVTTSSLYQYINAPIVAIFGLSEWSVRLPAAMAGTASVVATGALAWRWWGTSAGAWAALFVALSPWSLLLSRWANQSILLTLWVPLAVFCLAGHSRKSVPNAASTVFGAAFLLLALYTYAPARLFVPLFAAALWSILSLYAWRNGASAKAIGSFTLIFAAVLSLGAAPMAYHLLFESDASGARMHAVTIFDGQPLGAVILEWIRNYWLHISPGFLFAHGDANPRHSVSGWGQEHWFLLPLLVAGVIQAARRRERLDAILLAWLLLYPAAAACTRESVPHALRSIFAVPVIQLLSVYGLLAFAQWAPGWERRFSTAHIQAVRWGWRLFATISIIWFLAVFYARYPEQSAPYWEYGYRETVEWLRDNAPDTPVVVSGVAEYPYIFFLFYEKYPPDRWIVEQRIEGIHFLPTGQRIDTVYRHDGPPTLYLARPFEIPLVQPEKIIRLPNGDSIWKWAKGGRPPANESESDTH